MGWVYNVTEFPPAHPGGPDIVEAVCGMDSSHDFKDAAHSNASRKEGQIYLQGRLEGSEEQIPAMENVAGARTMESPIQKS